MRYLLYLTLLLTACGTPHTGHSIYMTSATPYARQIEPTTDFNTLRQWRGVLSRQPITTSHSVPSYAVMREINISINTAKPYRVIPDYWPTPEEFDKGNIADCKAIAIAKYYALRKSGWKPAELNLWSGDYDGKSHMVLVAKLNSDYYVLDIGAEGNLPLASHYFYKHFQPSYRFNENGWDTK